MSYSYHTTVKEFFYSEDNDLTTYAVWIDGRLVDKIGECLPLKAGLYVVHFSGSACGRVKAFSRSYSADHVVKVSVLEMD